MKKVLILTLSLALLFSSSSTLLAFGGSSCEIPKFLKKGSSYKIDFDGVYVKVLEIDKKSCYMKVHSGRGETFWLNIKNIGMIQPQKIEFMVA